MWIGNQVWKLWVKPNICKTWKDSDMESLSTGKANKIKDRVRSRVKKWTIRKVNSILD